VDDLFVLGGAAFSFAKSLELPLFFLEVFFRRALLFLDSVISSGPSLPHVFSQKAGFPLLSFQFALRKKAEEPSFQPRLFTCNVFSLPENPPFTKSPIGSLVRGGTSAAGCFLRLSTSSDGVLAYFGRFSLLNARNFPPLGNNIEFFIALC